MQMLNETDPANQPEKMQLRRDENTLMVVGSGVIIFGVWSVLKVLLLETTRLPEMMEEIRLQDLGLEETGIGDLSWVVAALTMVFILIGLLLDLSIRVFVGLSARAEGKGKKQGRVYLVLSALLLVVSGLSFCSYIYAFSRGSDQVMDSDAAILVELTSFVTLLQMILSAVRVRRARRAEQERG